MLLISGCKDELNETNAELGIEWKVVDFFSLSEEAGCYYQSPPFTFAKSSWNLQLFPGGDNIQNDTNSYISVYLRGSNFLELPNVVNYTIGMKKADGTIEKILSDKKHSFDEKSSVSGQQKFYQRSEIIRRKAELTPTGDFILTCTLKHNSVKTLEVTSHQMKLIDLERLYTDFKDLYSCKRSCDALVKVKDKEFRVHRSVLIARSSVFESMFEHDMKEKKTGVINIDDCDPDSFGEFLQYLYTGKAENVSPRSALHLYCTADKYDVKEFKSFCVEYLMRNLTVENVCDVVILADQFDEEELFSSAQVFFNKNVGRVLATVKWENLLQHNYRLANKLLKEMAAKIKIQV